jgi:hypothetical protein
MTADDKTRAIRMMMGQASVLHLSMAAARPERNAAQEGMLFKRNVEVPPNTSLDALLLKWNPGVPAETLADLATSVCRWNQLKSTSSVQPGQKLLIPSVLPHGKDPDLRRPAAGAERRPILQSRPQASPGVAISQNLREQRLRSQAAGAEASPVAPQLWGMPGQSGQAFAGANVKQQFQGGAWQQRPQQMKMKLRS